MADRNKILFSLPGRRKNNIFFNLFMSKTKVNMDLIKFIHDNKNKFICYPAYSICEYCSKEKKRDSKESHLIFISEYKYKEFIKIFLCENCSHWKIEVTKVSESSIGSFKENLNSLRKYYMY